MDSAYGAKVFLLGDTEDKDEWFTVNPAERYAEERKERRLNGLRMTEDKFDDEVIEDRDFNGMLNDETKRVTKRIRLNNELHRQSPTVSERMSSSRFRMLKELDKIAIVSVAGKSFFVGILPREQQKPSRVVSVRAPNNTRSSTPPLPPAALHLHRPITLNLMLVHLIRTPRSEPLAMMRLPPLLVLSPRVRAKAPPPRLYRRSPWRRR